MKNHLVTYILCIGTVLGASFSDLAQAESINAEVIDQYGTSWANGAASNIFATIYDPEVDSPNAQGQTLIAPGTHGEYTFTIKNKENKSLTYVLVGKEKNTYSVPIEYRYQLNSQSWLVGNDLSSVLGSDLYPMQLKRTLPKNTEETITLTWEWPFERELDEQDTQLGNQAVSEDELYKLELSIRGEIDEETTHSSDSATDDSTSSNKNNQGNSNQEKNSNLPQTGEKKNSKASVGVGIVLVSMSLYIVGKRKKNAHE